MTDVVPITDDEYAFLKRANLSPPYTVKDVEFARRGLNQVTESQSDRVTESPSAWKPIPTDFKPGPKGVEEPLVGKTVEMTREELEQDYAEDIKARDRAWDKLSDSYLQGEIVLPDQKDVDLHYEMKAEAPLRGDFVTESPSDEEIAVKRQALLAAERLAQRIYQAMATPLFTDQSQIGNMEQLAKNLAEIAHPIIRIEHSPPRIRDFKDLSEEPTKKAAKWVVRVYVEHGYYEYEVASAEKAVAHAQKIMERGVYRRAVPEGIECHRPYMVRAVGPGLDSQYHDVFRRT